jgi:hypothetical protein
MMSILYILSSIILNGDPDGTEFGLVPSFPGESLSPFLTHTGSRIVCAICYVLPAIPALQLGLYA